MGDDITIGVTEIVNNIEVTAQPSDQVIEIDVVDNSDDVTLNITPTVIEININKGSSFARWGTILGNLPDQADLQNVLNLKADLVGGLVPASQLPSYVDDIVEVANYAALPVVGETGKIYLTLDNNKIFRWSGSVYIEVAANNAIWGAITGTLSSQTDLQTALDTKALKTITITPNAPLSGGGDLSANRTISISQSNATTDGYLSSTDWITFNGKADDSLVVHKAGSETITGIKTFTGNSTIFDYTGASRLVFKADGTDTAEFSFGSTFTQITSKASDGYLFKNSAGSNSLTISNAGAGTFLSSLTATSFIKTGGTSDQYLKADGSVSTLTNPITGTGTINYLPKFTSSGTIGISNIIDNGSFIDILTGAVIAGNLNVNGVVSSGAPSNTLSIASGSGAIFVKNSSSNTAYAFQLNTSSGLDLWSTNSGGTSTRRLTLDSSGNLGIGKTSPSNPLHIGTAANSYLLDGLKVDRDPSTTSSAIFNAFGGAANIISNSGATSTFSPITFRASDNTTTNELMRITGSGNVGIGTTSPVQKLDILSGTANSDIAQFSGSVQGRGLKISTFSTGTTDAGVLLNAQSTFQSALAFATNGTESMRITSGGNVGIGTTSPAAKLSISYSSATADALNIVNTNTNGRSWYVGDGAGLGAGNFGFYDATAGASRLVISSGGNVGIGTTSPSRLLSLGGTAYIDVVLKSTSASGVAGGGTLYFGNSSTDSSGILNYDHGGNFMNFFTSGSERMRITSGGDVLINRTSRFGNEKMSIESSSTNVILTTYNFSASSVTHHEIRNQNGVVGSIVASGGSTLYNTSSDYRLKQDFKPFNGLNLISKIKVYDYAWKVDNSRMNGVIAHELQEVVPYAVNGEKDAEEMQSVDYSKLVPILVQAIQELKAEIEILKNK